MTFPNWQLEIYTACRRELFLSALAVLRDTAAAEDAVHAAFVRLVSQKNPPENARLYIFRAVRNAALDAAKQSKRRREEPLSPEWDSPTESAVGNTEFSEEKESQATLLQQALAQLDPASREVIELHLHSKLTFREIGELLEQPLQTVAARYRRALERIEKQIGQSQ